MSSTKAFNRYWSPEVTRLVSDLKEARERKTAVVNDFQYKVRIDPLVLASALPSPSSTKLTCFPPSLSLLPSTFSRKSTGLRRVRQGLQHLARRRQGRSGARLPHELV